jgi:hypothetical protein
MAEITGDSPQAVAYRLLEVIAIKEGKPLTDPVKGPDKAWVLSTYRECIDAVLYISKWGPYGG